MLLKDYINNLLLILKVSTKNYNHSIDWLWNAIINHKVDDFKFDNNNFNNFFIKFKAFKDLINSTDSLNLKLYTKLLKLLLKIDKVSRKSKNYILIYNMSLEEFATKIKIDLLLNLEVQLKFKRSVKYKNNNKDILKDVKVIEVTKDNVKSIIDQLNGKY